MVASLTPLALAVIVAIEITLAHIKQTTHPCHWCNMLSLSYMMSNGNVVTPPQVVGSLSLEAVALALASPFGAHREGEPIWEAICWFSEGVLVGA